MKITKLADLKRIPVGTKLRLVHTLFGPCNKPREVAKVSTTGLWFNQLDKPGDANRSWLQYPKAKDVKEIEGGFEIYEGDTLATRYLFEEVAQEKEEATKRAEEFVKDHFVIVHVG